MKPGNIGAKLGNLFAEDRRWIFAAAWLVVILGSLLSFLNFNDYSLISAESGLVAAGLATTAFLAGCLHAKAGRLRPAMDAALVFLAVDLNFDGWYATIAAAAALVVAIVRKKSIAPLLAVVFAFVVSGQLFAALRPATAEASPAVASKAAGKLPAVVHIVLDEHIGAEGLDATDPELAELRARLIRFYVGNGFTVFGGAHSRHFSTTNSLPEIFNFGKSQLGGESRANRASRIETNAYFDTLAARGYRINVRQSDFVDHCDHSAVISCNTYRRSDLQPLSGSPLIAKERALVIASAFASLSDGLMRLGDAYGYVVATAMKRGVRLPWVRASMIRLSSTLAALDAAEAFETDLRNAQSGQVYFAHLLFPHYPYAARADCSIKPLADWRYRRFGGDLASRTRAYAEQIQCAANIVDRMMRAIAQSPAGKNVVFVVHGDHGSRLTIDDPKVFNVDRIAGRDMIASYSTLFAVRMNGVPGAYEPRQAPVSSLLREFSESTMTAAPVVAKTDAEAQVYIEDSAWRPMLLRPLPAFTPSPGLRQN